MVYAWKLDRGAPAHPRDFDPRHNDGVGRKEGEAQLGALQAELGELQELCYAAQRHAVLLVVQGMDTSGKDGTIKKVMDSVNPQGCRVTSFKQPSALEQAHDFLWRVHSETPEQGMIGIFNRSHYEDVLIVRVHGLVARDVWRRRYEAINAFERVLTENRTILLKCFLHISIEEQAERLLARETDLDKRWKLNASDYLERQRWPEYMEAYADALRHCATSHAPWYVVPSDRKWFRNLAVAQVLVDTLRPYREEWQRALRDRGQKNYQELLELRAQGKGQL
jgi:PPK2 family polyphosphate:nucleotide phosphotransferase